MSGAICAFGRATCHIEFGAAAAAAAAVAAAVRTHKRHQAVSPSVRSAADIRRVDTECARRQLQAMAAAAALADCRGWRASAA